MMFKLNFILFLFSILLFNLIFVNVNSLENSENSENERGIYADITTIMDMVVMAGEAMVEEEAGGGLGMVGDGEIIMDMDITGAVKNNFFMKNISRKKKREKDFQKFIIFNF
ncbi:unnamed protein product [Meloidogyne enterolobii]|uniref:Uncharacterized protein n=1 Tax=Meloidogyne enterolobii TaxID=390850 RepID=A0ACB0YI04_MELEN